ncbi:MAG: nicotinamidase [Deltaproteobacteria bacterium]|nr:nicotinamidase [Deltaproteobacteria bacterium]
MKHQVQEPITLRRGDALSVTDVQNDFLLGGALGVPGGDKIISPLNRVIEVFRKNGLPVFFSRDWHPPDHCSFKSQGGPWPPHCVRNTSGADYPPGLNIPEGAIIISKGTEKDSEQYSTFYGRDKEGNTKSDLMRKLGIKRVFIAGLATDYCVLNSVNDALAEGYEVSVLTDAIAAVDVNPGDGARALEEMVKKGAKIISSAMIQG